MTIDKTHPEVAQLIYKERLNAIAVAYYTLCAPIFFTGLVFVIYIFMGVMFLAAPEMMSKESVSSNAADEIAAVIMGSLFSIIGSIMTITHCGGGILMGLSAWGMQRQKWRRLSIVTSILALPFLPFGTVAGIFALLTLFKPEVKATYQQNKQQSEALP